MPKATTPVTYDQLDRASKSFSSESGYSTFDRSNSGSDAYDHFNRVTPEKGSALFQVGSQDWFLLFLHCFTPDDIHTL